MTLLATQVDCRVGNRAAIRNVSKLRVPLVELPVPLLQSLVAIVAEVGRRKRLAHRCALSLRVKLERDRAVD